MENLSLTGSLKKTATEFHDRRALLASGKFDLTHAQLQEVVDHAASLLLASGVGHGDVVALTFPNTVEVRVSYMRTGTIFLGFLSLSRESNSNFLVVLCLWQCVVMFLAVIRCRATAAPLNAAYTAEEFEFYLSDSQSKLLITSPEGNKPAQAAASKLGIPHLTAALSGADTRIELSSTTSESSLEAVAKIVNDPSDVALFLHTSGTTSRPKGVPLTQLNLASSVLNIKSVYKLTESDSTVIVLPLFHVHGLIAGLLSSLVAGAAVTLPAAGRFSASTFWTDMLNYKATWYTAVPTIHQIILDRHLGKPEAAYPNLRFIRSCSASLAPSILARLEETFGAPVLEAYAMTEASHLMASNPLPEDGEHKAGSVGKPVGQEMAILDENGVVQLPGVKGEVCIRGANVTKGYKNNPEANKAAFQFGWFHTGDVGFFDQDGYLHLVGRIKELINRGGNSLTSLFLLH